VKRQAVSETELLEQTLDAYVPAISVEAALEDKRVQQLLEIIRELEEWKDRLSDSQFAEALQFAARACGFDDAVEAWQAIVTLVAIERSLTSSALS